MTRARITLRDRERYLAERATIPAGSLVLGVPGKIVRALGPEVAEGHFEHARRYAELADQYRREAACVFRLARFAGEHESVERVAFARKGQKVPLEFHLNTPGGRFEHELPAGHAALGYPHVVQQCIVQRHHGQITVRSQPGQGTDFIVTLPLVHTAVAAETSHPE